MTLTRTGLIGDIHGRIFAVKEAYEQHPEYLLIQMGDFGFSGTYAFLNRFDPERLKIIGGNHDCYPDLINHPHYLGDFGILDLPGGQRAFFIRGAWSIDRHSRTAGLDWWPEEELNLRQQEDCFRLYEQECDNIDLILSHDAPSEVQRILVGEGRSLFGGFYPNSTGEFLSQIWNHKKPKQWFFAHWHLSWSRKIDSTMFRCIDIDELVII